MKASIVALSTNDGEGEVVLGPLLPAGSKITDSEREGDAPSMALFI